MKASDCLWAYPQGELILSQDEVHIWWVSLDQSASCVQRLTQMLSSDEHMRAERFHFKKDREHFIVCRGLLRMILGQYLDNRPDQLQFRYAPNGKPALVETFNGSRLCFNLSHSHGIALYAVTCCRDIGIDIEFIRLIPDAEQIADHFFSARENAVFRILPAYQRLEAFFNCWTRKEAYLKAIGEGLVRSLDQFDVTLAPGEPARLLHIEGVQQEVSRWSLHDLAPTPGYAAAIAVEGHDWHLKYWQWEDEF